MCVYLCSVPPCRHCVHYLFIAQVTRAPSLLPTVFISVRSRRSHAVHGQDSDDALSACRLIPARRRVRSTNEAVRCTKSKLAQTSDTIDRCPGQFWPPRRGPDAGREARLLDDLDLDRDQNRITFNMFFLKGKFYQDFKGCPLHRGPSSGAPNAQ